MSTDIVLILPTQLFAKHPCLDKKNPVIVYEHPHYFTSYNYHKQKLILHRASMRSYYDVLKKKKYDITYVGFKEKILPALKKHKDCKTLHITDPVDKAVIRDIKKIAKQAGCKLETHETPMFLSPLEWLEKKLTGKKKYIMGSFYQAQRKRLDILIKNGKPVGGKWSFDELNREPLPKTQALPTKPRTCTNKYITEAKKYIAKHFKSNIGNGKTFYYPVTHTEAKSWLNTFLQKRFDKFGTYEDAMVDGHPFLFHSVLSPFLNIGLLTPQEVVESALSYAKTHKKVKINDLEGFIRQIIGWREFIRGIYHFHGSKQEKGNALKYRKKMPASLYDGSTGIYPIDSTIKQLDTYAFGHHIQRLMILGNFMFLCGIKPKDVYTWFMEFFIDAYDWVMVPNVYGMSQYADGGLMTTKPYFSGSNYILKMSNYRKDDWCTIWDGLYWQFVDKHKTLLSKNPRWKMMVSTQRKMNPEKKKMLFKAARDFLKRLK